MVFKFQSDIECFIIMLCIITSKQALRTGTATSVNTYFNDGQPCFSLIRRVNYKAITFFVILPGIFLDAKTHSTFFKSLNIWQNFNDELLKRFCLRKIVLSTMLWL